MLIYNVTTTIDLPYAEAWMQWLLKKHIGEVMATGCFENYRVNKLLNHDHPDAEIFTIQYTVKDMDTLIRYQKDHAPTLQEDPKRLFAGKYAAFRTVMEVKAEG
jgi:ABC-type Fe3+ transport system substrate-binding protein